MKKYIILCLLMTGCATVAKKQAECENVYSAFPDVVTCTKKAFANNARAENDPNFKLYILKGEQLAGKVISKEIGDLDAKVEWQKLYVEIRNNERNFSEVAATKFKSRKTICKPIGGTLSCDTD